MITLNNADERAEWKLHRARYLDDARHRRERSVMREASEYADAAIEEYRERLPETETETETGPPPSPDPQLMRCQACGAMAIEADGS